MQKVFLHLHTEFTFPDFYLYRNIFPTFDLSSGWDQCGGVFIDKIIIILCVILKKVLLDIFARDMEFGKIENRVNCSRYYRASTEDYNPRD